MCRKKGKETYKGRTGENVKKNKYGIEKRPRKRTKRDGNSRDSAYGRKNLQRENKWKPKGEINTSRMK